VIVFFSLGERRAEGDGSNLALIIGDVYESNVSTPFTSALLSPSVGGIPRR
jgi:hypothetical protein